jgi:glycosyltransferase involved in cell wall biosynthesis
MITFIVPTVNRPTLNRSIQCLLSQNNPNWKAIVAFDGLPALHFPDDRIKSISVPKLGKLNHAGNVRNIAISQADTDWVAFLDDDDTISNNYVDRFYEETIENTDTKCIIFRMKTLFDPAGILPEPNHNTFFKCRVGISFAMKKDINLMFEPSHIEDFTLLNKIREKGHKMIISPYVTYFVRENPCETSVFKRVKINY